MRFFFCDWTTSKLKRSKFFWKEKEIDKTNERRNSIFLIKMLNVMSISQEHTLLLCFLRGFIQSTGSPSCSSNGGVPTGSSVFSLLLFLSLFCLFSTFFSQLSSRRHLSFPSFFSSEHSRRPNNQVVYVNSGAGARFLFPWCETAPPHQHWAVFLSLSTFGLICIIRIG